MIRINLLRKTSRKRAHIRPLPFIIGGVVLVLVIGSGSLLLLRPKPIKPKAVAVVEHVTKPAVKVPEQKAKTLAPSSFVAERQVEDVVTDVSDTVDVARKDGKLLLPYSQLSFTEQINFEGLFTRHVCEMLVRAIPDDIGLRSLELANFQTVYAVGLGNSKENVNVMFTTIKKERVELLSPPYSFIRANGAEGYRFAFTVKAMWGIDLTDPFVDLSLATLPDNESLPSVISTFSSMGKKHGITLVPPAPVQTDVSQTGLYRRYSYRVTGSGSFVDFVAWVKALYDQRMQCAFQKLTITAKSKSLVSLDGVVIFTVRK